MGLWTRIRQNLTLKIVSTVAAILLYIFVQQERNPTILKTVAVNVDYRKAQDGYQVIPTSKRITVTVTGPRSSVELLKDGDIKATADLSGVTSNQSNSPARITYELPKGIADIALDAPEFIQVQVYRQKTRKLAVEAIWKHESLAGLKYGEPTIHPFQVSVRGREDVVNRIFKIAAFASPVEPKANIDGDFSLLALDSDQNVIEGVDIIPERVHVTIPQVLLPAEQIVPVQTPFSDRPAAPYVLSDTVYMPNNVKLIGTPQRVADIRAINTETLSVHDLTSTTSMDAALITPPGVQVRDLQGRPITHVKVTFIISKAKTEPSPGPDTPSTTAPKHDGPTSP